MGTSDRYQQPAVAVAPAWVQAAGRGVVAAVVTALVSAVLTRVLMRAVVVLTNGEPRFNFDSIVFIAFFYILCLLPGCVALAIAARWWSWALLAAGTALLAFQAVNIGLQETAHVNAMTTGRWVGFGAALLAMLLGLRRPGGGGSPVGAALEIARRPWPREVGPVVASCGPPSITARSPSGPGLFRPDLAVCSGPCTPMRCSHLDAAVTACSNGLHVHPRLGIRHRCRPHRCLPCCVWGRW